MAEIRILVSAPGEIEIRGDNDGLTEVDKVLILNCLAEAIELTWEQKKMIGIILYGGGLDALGVTGKDREVIEEDMIRVLTQMEDKNETDAL